MRKTIKIFTIVLVMLAMTFLGLSVFKPKIHDRKLEDIDSNVFTSEKNPLSKNITQIPLHVNNILQDGNGILFLETTNRMEPPSLVLCALESAARVYPDRPVVFFMKGLGDIATTEDQKRAKQRFPVLSSFKNIYFSPLRMEELFKDTPFMPWFKKIIPEKQVYWTHVSSDACRFSLMWHYGGIYMDTDIISMRPVPTDKFVAAEDQDWTSSSAYGLPPLHPVTLKFMKNFVDNYKGNVWGQQGPGVFTRVVKEMCGLPVFTSVEDVMCNNISYFHPRRFYPIPCAEWKKYFEEWKNDLEFKNSFSLHLWNYMNRGGKSMVPGSNTLVEHLYQQYCPTNYASILKNQKG